MNQRSDSSDENLNQPPPNAFWRPLIISLVLFIVIGLIILGIFPRLSQFKTLKQDADRASPSITVELLIAEPNRQPVDLILPSYLQAINITPIWARTNGYLNHFYVDIGDVVKAGQLLADIETPEIDQELSQARADLEKSEAQLEIARVTADRWKNLYQKNPEAISVQEVDEKMATLQSTTASILAAKANVKRLEALQGFNKIYAPFDGTIIKRDIDIGSLITAGSNGNPQELFRIARTDILRAFVDVPQTFYRLIKDGLEAEITVKEYQGKTFKGIISRNAGALEPISRTLLTQVNIDNRSQELLVGLYAEVKISFIPDRLIFIVPTNALIIRSGPPFLAIVDEDHKVHLQQVEIGLNFGKTVEILSGIRKNDRIIINPNDKIKEGVLVKPVPTRAGEPSSPPNATRN